MTSITTQLLGHAKERIHGLFSRKAEEVLPPPATAEQPNEQQASQPAPSIADSCRTTTSSTVVGDDSGPHVHSLARRIHGWSWQAFPVGMGTSAVYLTLSGWSEECKPRDMIEHIFFYLTLVIFFINLCSLILQAILYPRRAKDLLMDPVKGVFFPLMVLSLASIIVGIMDNEYGACRNICGPSCAEGWFWFYVAMAIITCYPLLILWFNNPHPLSEFTPVYAFLIFPLMLTGVVAFNALKVVPHDRRASLHILVMGYVFQGLGCFMTFFYICIYILRIITGGVLKGRQATGAFIVCGPPGFTALAIIKLGDNARDILQIHDLISPSAGEVWYAGSVMGGVMLYGLAVFLFVFSAVPWAFNVSRDLHDVLGLWALTFPNVGWILATRVIGDTFRFKSFAIVHIILCICLAVAWVVLSVLTLVAFKRGYILHSNPEAVLKDAVYKKRNNRGSEGETTVSVHDEEKGEYSRSGDDELSELPQLHGSKS